MPFSLHFVHDHLVDVLKDFNEFRLLLLFVQEDLALMAQALIIYDLGLIVILFIPLLISFPLLLVTNAFFYTKAVGKRRRKACFFRRVFLPPTFKFATSSQRVLLSLLVGKVG